MEKRRFERVFLLFTREDEEVIGGQSPSGYVKQEIIDGRIKLTTNIQGLRQLSGEELYLYLFSQGYGKIRFFNVGKLLFVQTKCEMTRDIILDNSSESYETLRKVDGAVVVGLRSNKGIPDIYCPLVAFRNSKRLDYKEDLKATILIKESDKEKDDIERKEKQSEQAEVKEEIQTVVPMPSSISEKEKEAPALSSESMPVQNVVKEAENINNKESGEFEVYQNMLKQLGIPYGINEQENICMEPVTQIQKEICEDCNKVARSGRDSGGQRINAARLRIIFNKYFETYDPFKIKRPDYRWWKVGSPVQLNNLLYQNNIKTPLLFNPQLMMAHFKYRHILVGTYCNIRRGKEYIVCGVPAVYNVDERPYGEYCRWAQLESTKPRHGAFGYWLVYIDIKTGNFLGL